MAGADKKNRVSPLAAQSTAMVDEENKELFDELTGTMYLLEHDALERNEAHKKLCAEIDEVCRSKRTKYTAEDKLQCALGYIGTGSCAATSRLIGISAATIRSWKSTAPWWPRAIEIALMVKREHLDVQLQKIQDLANVEVINRIENGDEQVLSTGEIIRKRIGGKDLMTISAIARDKQSILRGQPTSITEKVSSGDKLAELAAKITEAVNNAGGNVIDGTVIEDKEDDNPIS